MIYDDGLLWLENLNQMEVRQEDLAAKKGGRDTITDLEAGAPDWLAQAAQKTQAASGDDYVQLDCGLLTVNQINIMLQSIVGELTYCDDNHQLMWYNRRAGKKMMAKRTPEQIGASMAQVHPDINNVILHTQQVWHGLRTKASGRDEVWVPVSKGLHQPITHYNRYKRMEDEEGNFRGISEWVVDLKPLAEYYCQTNGLKMVTDPTPQRPDLVPSPGDLAFHQKESGVDSISGASES